MTDPEVDFTTVARGYGAWADTPVTSPGELAPALRAALEQVDGGRVALVDVRTSPE
jgi:acetolactate synthase I/II/III large subunit